MNNNNNNKLESTTAGSKDGRRADRGRLFSARVLTHRLISREWQSAAFEDSHKQTSEREYTAL